MIEEEDNTEGAHEFSHVFSGSPLDRCNNMRGNEDFVKGLKQSPNSIFLPFWNMKPLIVDQPSNKKVMGFRKWDTLKTYVEERGCVVVYLGKEKGEEDIGYFAVDLSTLTGDEAKVYPNPEERFSDLRPVVSLLPLQQASILAQVLQLALLQWLKSQSKELKSGYAIYVICSSLPKMTQTRREIWRKYPFLAKSMLEWHVRNVYCGKCGSITTTPEGAHKRVCPNCNESSSDPAMLVLVVKGEKCLLTHNVKHPKGIYTCVAGFMEPGESIEECVRREVLEETGIIVGRVTYHSSQPWPFPFSIMIGCVAVALSDQIIIDKKELEDGQWYDREQAKILLQRSLKISLENPSTEFRTPPPLSLAHQLIKVWIEKNKL